MPNMAFASGTMTDPNHLQAMQMAASQQQQQFMHRGLFLAVSHFLLSQYFNISSNYISMKALFAAGDSEELYTCFVRPRVQSLPPPCTTFVLPVHVLIIFCSSVESYIFPFRIYYLVADCRI